jgi:DNA-binding CsgD family transcriptional regulator/PAS domain-containing protein
MHFAASPIIESFYGAALGHGQWSDALDRLGNAVQADHLILSAETPSPFLASVRVDERDLTQAMSVLTELPDDGPSTARLRGGEVALRSALILDTDYVRTSHYNELVRPLGGFHGIAAKVTATAEGSILAICRGSARPDFAAADVRAVEAMLPHLGMAIDIRRRMARADAAVSSLETLLDGVGEGAMLCDRSQRPLFANAAARRLLAEDDGLGAGVAGLFGATPEDTRRLRAGIAMAESLGVARFRLSRRSGRPPLMLRVVAASNLGLDAGRSGAVVVFLSEPDAVRPVDREAIAEAFGLTRREAEVAALLANGASPSAIAAELGLGTASVRVYLKRIYNKTEVRTQAALVAMIRGFV